MYNEILANYKPLSQEEELRLTTRFSISKDKKDLDLLVKHNLRLVINIANGILPKNDDLVSEGVLGLIKSINVFDPKKGLRLSTFAYPYIKGHVLMYVLYNDRIVKNKFGGKRAYLYYNLQKIKSNLLSKGIDVNSDTLVQYCKNCTDKDIENAEGFLTKDVSLENKLNYNSEDGNAFEKKQLKTETLRLQFSMDPSSPEEDYSELEYLEWVKSSLKEFKSTLTPLEFTIFHNRSCAENPMTLCELSAMTGKVYERIRQIEVSMFDKFNTVLIKKEKRAAEKLATAVKNQNL